MENFELKIPTKIFFGENQIEKLPEIIGDAISNVLLVYGGGSIKKNGLYDETIALLDKYNVIELPGISSNPRIEQVREGVRLSKENNVELVLAVGGGSVVDASKVIAAGAVYNGDAWDLVMDHSLITDALPLVDILTLAATGTEMNNVGVVTNFEARLKKSARADALYPMASILDPTYTYTVNAWQTAVGTADIMSHTFENYFQNVEGAFIQDRLSEGILKSCIHYLPQAIENPEDYEARANLMWAATNALNGLTRIGKWKPWSCHPIEHAISAYHDISHGAGLSLLTTHWMQYVLNEETAPDFARIAYNVWDVSKDVDEMKAAQIGIDKLIELYKKYDLPQSLRELGVDTKENFDVIAEQAATRLGESYVPLDEQDVLNILESCY